MRISVRVEKSSDYPGIRVVNCGYMVSFSTLNIFIDDKVIKCNGSCARMKNTENKGH